VTQQGGRKILIVAPHPDDEVLGCGGTICRAIAAGHDVWVCIVTRGSPAIFEHSFVERGRTEARAVHAELGVVDTLFCDFPAPMLDTIPRHQVSDALRGIIDSLAIDTVFIPHGGDIHFEHTIVAEAALVACRPIRGSSVKRVYAYETLSETEWAPPQTSRAFIPNVFVDISGYIDAKLRAMNGYASQIQQAPHPRSAEGIQSLAKLRGLSIGCHYAEAFMLIREIVDVDPTSSGHARC